MPGAPFGTTRGTPPVPAKGTTRGIVVCPEAVGLFRSGDEVANAQPDGAVRDQAAAPPESLWHRRLFHEFIDLDGDRRDPGDRRLRVGHAPARAGAGPPA